MGHKTQIRTFGINPGGAEGNVSNVVVAGNVARDNLQPEAVKIPMDLVPNVSEYGNVP